MPPTDIWPRAAFIFAPKLRYDDDANWWPGLAMCAENVAELKNKRICFQCVGEDYLNAEIKSKGKRAKCTYCQGTRRSYSIGEVAELIEIAFDQHYVRTSDQPNDFEYMMIRDRESSYEWERHGEPVVYAIMNAADIPEKVAEDIQKILDDKYSDFDADEIGEETEFSGDSYYEESAVDDQVLQEQWKEFEQYLKYEARFFSRNAAAHLVTIFNGIDKMHTTSGRSLVVDAGPGTKLEFVYRARVFQNHERLQEALCRPDLHLGPPPYRFASAGRMNARGISVFYGANDPKVAIAEVRPPVGSKVMVGQFQIIKELRLLDLTAFQDIRAFGSLFDSDTAGKLERAKFLRSLSERITRQVMPDDEDFEYLTTQAIADFLATESSIMLDGIIFPSVQTSGLALNVVLFHKAAKVESLTFPDGTELNAHEGYSDEDGWNTDYTVWEDVPVEEDSEQNKEKCDDWPDFAALIASPQGGGTFDSREVTLRIILERINVHEVRSVIFEADEFKVTRHRYKKHPSIDI